MKFGGLVAIGDLSFEARRGEITALIGPNGAGKTTVFNCITGFYKPTEGMITLTGRNGNAVPARAPAGLPDPGQGEGGAHLPEHPAVLRHDAAREPAGGAAQQADAGVGLHRARPARLRRLPQGVGGIDRAGQALAGEGRARRPRRRSGRRPALWRAAPAGDRARHVHRAGTALPRRAGGRPQPAGIAGAERAAQRHQGHHRHVDPADRARHVGGHADFRPRRRAGIRPQDLRRRSGVGEERPARHRRLSRRRRRRSHATCWPKSATSR